MAINDWMLTAYWDCIRVALATAPHNELQPHFIFDGPERPELDYLRARGVTVHHHRVSFYDQLMVTYAALADDCCNWCMDKMKVAPGVFLRCDIPLLCDDAYAFYTDADVMFTGQRLQLEQYLPALFAAGPEFERTHWHKFNAGVLLLNCRGLRPELPKLLDHLGGEYDQDALLGLAAGRWSRLDPLYNWKAYWPVNANAKIIHFHGPKPDWRAAPTADAATLEPLRTASFYQHERQWVALRDSLNHKDVSYACHL